MPPNSTPAATTPLTPQERARLGWYKWEYVAQGKHGFDKPTARRLSFARYLAQRGILNETMGATPRPPEEAAR